MLSNESNSNFSNSIFELPVDSLISLIACWALSTSLPVITHLAPALANALAVSTPIPLN